MCVIFSSDLHQGSLLRNIRKRYAARLIYVRLLEIHREMYLHIVMSDVHVQTYTGSILVAVNPYKLFDIYNLNMVRRYEGQLIGKLSP